MTTQNQVVRQPKIDAEPAMNETPRTPVPAGHGDGGATGHGSHRGHGWMMMICCIPMLVIAIALVATGTASAGFLFTALLCTAMMALMMRGMDHTSTTKPAAGLGSPPPLPDHEHHHSPSR